MITPNGMPTMVGSTKMRKTPSAPTGHRSGKGAEGSNCVRRYCARNVFRSSIDIQPVAVWTPRRLRGQNGPVTFGGDDADRRFAATIERQSLSNFQSWHARNA